MDNSHLTALGDSIIKGVVLVRDGEQSKYTLAVRSIVDLCAERLHVIPLNLGKMGCTILSGEQVIDRFWSRISGSKYVLLEYGGNDSDFFWSRIADDPHSNHQPRTPLDVYESAYERVINKIRLAGAEPVVLSLPPLDADRYFELFSAGWSDRQRQNVIGWLGGSTAGIVSGHELYNMATWKVAGRTGARWIDVTTDWLLTHHYQDMLCEDGIHPNEQGQKLIAEAILKQLS